MDERTALSLLTDELSHAGDDAAVVGSTVITTDMLHQSTDFPSGTTRYTAGWRAVGASLSDVAAMGADATAAVAVYADTEFKNEELLSFVRGASDVCESVGGSYVGGDLDQHSEFTVATTAIGELTEHGAVLRSGATVGDRVCVTGTLGRTAAALQYFEDGESELANDLFQFPPRVAAGTALACHATAMMDSSDGLARSLHQLSEASNCGFRIDRDAVPIDAHVYETTTDAETAWEAATTVGEDFELVCTVPESSIEQIKEKTDAPFTAIGTVTEQTEGLTVNGEPLADEGYTHS
ncbi:thiamine-phosphate kinase [Halorubraceae archaeon YAN]|nr:thiamine-phosphate kinase [Halorubraceae archaeon YAN]